MLVGKAPGTKRMFKCGDNNRCHFSSKDTLMEAPSWCNLGLASYLISWSFFSFNIHSALDWGLEHFYCKREDSKCPRSEGHLVSVVTPQLWESSHKQYLGGHGSIPVTRDSQKLVMGPPTSVPRLLFHVPGGPGISTPGQLAGDAECQAPPQNYWIRIALQQDCPGHSRARQNLRSTVLELDANTWGLFSI